MQVIRDFDGYPKLRDLRIMLPSLTPVKIKIIVHYLERSGVIVMDSDGYIIWMRKESLEQLTLGEIAEMSSDLKELLDKRHE